jgi:hypothetical protein
MYFLTSHRKSIVNVRAFVRVRVRACVRACVRASASVCVSCTDQTSCL